MGFSVTGRVLNSIEGEGVTDASVSLNNHIRGNSTTGLHTNKATITQLENRGSALSVFNCKHVFTFACFALAVISKEDGSFRLENMTAGTYTIRVNKELMFFEPITVKIAPSTPQLPDIITAGYLIL